MVNSMTKEEINSDPNYLWMYMMQLVVPGTATNLMACVHYVRHKPLRQTVLKEIKDFWYSRLESHLLDVRP